MRKGFTILEACMAIIVASIMMTTYMFKDMSNQRMKRDEQIASQMEMIGDAAKKYIITNNVNLSNLLTDDGKPLMIAVGKTSRYMTISQAMMSVGGLAPTSLQNEGYLDSDFINLNPYGQNYYLMIGKDGAGNLVGMIISYGGQAIQDYETGRIVEKLGMNGGYIPSKNIGSENTNQIYGYNGSWVANVSQWNTGYTPSAGHPVFRVFPFNGEGSTDYISRYNTGNPEDQRMHTSLYMSNNGVVANSIDTTFMKGSSINATGNTTNDKQNNIRVTGNVEIYKNLGVGVNQQNGTFYSTDANEPISGFADGTHTRDINARHNVINADNSNGNIIAYMSHDKGAIAATAVASGQVIRSNMNNVTAGDTCDGNIQSQSLDGHGSGDIAAQSIHIGDMTHDMNTGLLLTCQQTDEGKHIWIIAMSPFSHTQCHSGSSYTNNDGVAEAVYFTTGTATSKSADHFGVNANDNESWLSQHSDASVFWFGISTKDGHKYSSMQMLSPGQTARTDQMSAVQYCVQK